MELDHLWLSALVKLISHVDVISADEGVVQALVQEGGLRGSLSCLLVPEVVFLQVSPEVFHYGVLLVEGFFQLFSQNCVLTLVSFRNLRGSNHLNLLLDLMSLFMNRGSCCEISYIRLGSCADCWSCHVARKSLRRLT